MKENLINTLKSKHPNLTKAQLSALVEDTLNAIITQTHQQQKPFVFRGVGTFRPVRRAAREGRNPQTGEVIQLAAKNTISFKLSPGYEL